MRETASFEIRDGMFRGMPVMGAWTDPLGRLWVATGSAQDGEYFGCRIWLRLDWTYYGRDDTASRYAEMRARTPSKLRLASTVGLFDERGRERGDETVQRRQSAPVVISNGTVNGERMMGAWEMTGCEMWFLAMARDQENYYGYLTELRETWGLFPELGFGRLGRAVREVAKSDLHFRTNFLMPVKRV